jgi:two-component system, sensor histidine kinase and response regulator
MPEMNGYEAATELRRVQRFSSRVPIIAMTADATVVSRYKCAQVGMDDFVPKPVKLGDLVAVLEKHLRTCNRNEVDGISARVS